MSKDRDTPIHPLYRLVLTLPLRSASYEAPSKAPANIMRGFSFVYIIVRSRRWLSRRWANVGNTGRQIVTLTADSPSCTHRDTSVCVDDLHRRRWCLTITTPDPIPLNRPAHCVESS